jgi:hypothetical protein
VFNPERLKGYNNDLPYYSFSHYHIVKFSLMSNGFFKVPIAHNEPVKSYAPGSIERAELKKKLAEMRSEVRDIPMFIGGKEVTGEKKIALNPPHDHQHLLGYFYWAIFTRAKKHMYLRLLKQLCRRVANGLA